MNYYNELDPFAAQWLRNLISKQLIPEGFVDERDIRDVRPKDLEAYCQCHFFAGIAGWPLALALAHWPSDRPVWTGSCPCQPFSTAGKGGGFADERHLWPYWHYLIEQCRPPVLFGEQVASPQGLSWLDLVSSDLEGSAYAFAAADLGAAGVGAPHIRQRCWFVADADARGFGKHGRPAQRIDNEPHIEQREPIGDMGDAHEPGSQGRRIDAGEHADQRSAWSASDWLPCTDGKARPVEPGTFPLAHGIPCRVGRLRAYGNAIVPQVAAAFIRATMR